MIDVTAVCATYGRPQLLEEAVESYLRQDFGGSSELLICNDCDYQEMRCDAPGVRVVNTGKRFPSLGEKFNWMFEEAKGRFIAPWDDDDLYLPHRLSHSMGRIDEYGLEYYKLRSCYYMENNEVLGVRYNNIFFGSGMWSRDLAIRVGGCGKADTTNDQIIEVQMWKKANGYLIMHPEKPQDTYFVWRIGDNRPHMSMLKTGVGISGYRAIIDKDNIRGKIEIMPKYLEDYEAMCAEASDD